MLLVTGACFFWHITVVIVTPITKNHTVLAELQFLPSLYYLAWITRFPLVLLEQHENYNKGSFRNKCMVRSNQKNQYMIIPLSKGKNRSKSIQDVMIAYEEDWPRVMSHRLQTEYGSFPYYSYYIDDILKIVDQRWDYLFDLNASLLKYFFSLLDFENYTFTEHYIHESQVAIMDLRDKITPRYFQSSPDLLSMTKMSYFHFVPAHSFIESLFSYGPEISLLLKEYQDHLPANFPED